MEMETQFAPAERATPEEIRRQYEKLTKLPFVRDFLDAVPNMSVVLNAERQIVFANRAFTTFLGLADTAESDGSSPCDLFGCAYADVLGLRPGEAVGCIRSRLTRGGCGTTAFCQTCGAVGSILNSQKLRAVDIQECRMLCAGQNEEQNALDLRVWSRPIDVDGDSFTVFSVMDISNEKRRKALERIFFHDVLNTANGVQGLAELLVEDGLSDAEVKDLSGMIAEAARHLIEEICDQQMLSSAEIGDLTVSVEEVHSLGLIAQVLRQFHSYNIAKGKVLEVDATSEEFGFDSDPVLLRRVLVNLVKNALEAVSAGGVVTLSCRTKGDHVYFSVHDAEVMEPEIQMQLFSRSFSTKGMGRGLGTYSIKLITERYLRGRVSFISNDEVGTVFTVRYPKQIPASAGSVGQNDQA